MNSVLKVMFSNEVSPPTKGAPTKTERKMMNGISGGKVIWEAMKVSTLFSLK
ncbi:hypothetical protein SDC9_154847 [bioreactor metagenome]|uniref:Uncharacterized protein n=1 Tax=bioreactor metagenome TaxID=1076179 RepID=A0A645F1N7_9ZZZZ